MKKDNRPMTRESGKCMDTMQQNELKCPGCGKPMEMCIFPHYKKNAWNGRASCNCTAGWGTAYFEGKTREEVEEKIRIAALGRPLRKPLDFEAFADRARNDPHFIPILEIREVYFNQTDVTLTPVRFDLQDIRRNDAYACYLFGQADPRFLKIKEYGITWRCWEDVPSVEEQKAAFVGGEIR